MIDLTVFSAAGLWFGVAFLVSGFLVPSKHFYGVLTLDVTNGEQKFHGSTTRRIGGSALAVGYVVPWVFLNGKVNEI